jgi:hypothetical protein
METLGPAVPEEKPELRLFKPSDSGDVNRTVVLPSAVRAPRPAAHAPVYKASDYAFLKCLERNALGELWKVQGPTGEHHLAQFLPPIDVEQEIQKLETIYPHRGLAHLTVARGDHNQPILLTEVPDMTLRDRFVETWTRGSPGLPRKELLSYLRLASDTLDSLVEKTQLQHLNLNPRTMVIQAGCFALQGFGMVELFCSPTRGHGVLFNQRYSAPEQFRGYLSHACDQYSLALIYAELRTGVHPWHGLRDGWPGEHDQPDTALLSIGEREIIARALSYRPMDRFPTCSEMVRALEDECRAMQREGVHEYLRPIIAVASGQGGEAVPYQSLDRFVADLVTLASGPIQYHEYHKIRYSMEPGKKLEHRCAVQLYAGAIRLKLEGFRNRWRARLVHEQDDLLIFNIRVQPTFLQRLMSRRMGLEIEVRLTSPVEAKHAEVHVVIRPFGCSGERAIKLLQELGPAVLESVRMYLQARPDMRTSDRWPLCQPLRVCPVVGGLQLADPIDCRAKDVSSSGIGFYLTEPPTAGKVYVNLPGLPDLADCAGLAQIVRKQRRNDGWYEVGASFLRQPPSRRTE